MAESPTPVSGGNEDASPEQRLSVKQLIMTYEYRRIHENNPSVCVDMSPAAITGRKPLPGMVATLPLCGPPKPPRMRVPAPVPPPERPHWRTRCAQFRKCLMERYRLVAITFGILIIIFIGTVLTYMRISHDGI